MTNLCKVFIILTHGLIMEIVDILQAEDFAKHKENLSKLCKWIEANDNHRNAKNYYSLQNTIDKFDSFEIIYDDDKIVAFSGLWNNGTYPKNIARCSTRTYYHPDYRNKGSSRTARWSEDWFIPYEVNRAIDLGYDYAFISIELLMRRRSMQDLVAYLGKDRQWILHQDMCNTCRQHNDKGDYIGVNKDPNCWQNVCFTPLKSVIQAPFSLPSINIAEYNKTYADTQKARIQRLR